MLIAVVYCRPYAAPPDFFFNCLSTFFLKYSNILVTGDFNADLFSPTKKRVKDFPYLVSAHGFHFVSTEPTHYLINKTPPSHTTLDLSITSDLTSIQRFSKSTALCIDNHDFIEVDVRLTNKKPLPKLILTTSLKKLNPVILNSGITTQLTSIT